MSLNLIWGTSDLVMKVMVFFPLIPHFKPCANHLNSFSLDWFHTSLKFGCHGIAQYSNKSPVSWSRTGFAASWHLRAMLSAMLALDGWLWRLSLTRLAMLLEVVSWMAGSGLDSTINLRGMCAIHAPSCHCGNGSCDVLVVWHWSPFATMTVLSDVPVMDKSSEGFVKWLIAPESNRASRHICVFSCRALNRRCHFRKFFVKSGQGAKEGIRGRWFWMG